MGFSTNRTKRHGTGSKSLNNILHGLDFIQRNCLGRIELELQLTPQSDLLVLLISESRKLLVRIPGIGSRCDLKIHHTSWCIQMRLTAIAVVELTIASNQNRVLRRMHWVSVFVEPFKVPVNSLEVGSLDSSGSSCEAPINNFVSKSDSLEYLSTLVTLKRGNSHLAHNLKQSLCSRFSVILHAFFVCEFLLRHGLDHALSVHLANSFVRHVWANTVTSVSENSGIVMNLLRITNLGKNCCLRSLLGSDQVMVDGAHSQ
mmetsp:Transcript_17776/g.27460  ORF Transcript_17776/g.27460 Transcript_17776/m.27460 type:complete len:259 (+) Transcript_17776:1961-2737(+)